MTLVNELEASESSVLDDIELLVLSAPLKPLTLIQVMPCGARQFLKVLLLMIFDPLSVLMIPVMVVVPLQTMFLKLLLV